MLQSIYNFFLRRYLHQLEKIVEANPDELHSVINRDLRIKFLSILFPPTVLEYHLYLLYSEIKFEQEEDIRQKFKESVESSSSMDDIERFLLQYPDISNKSKSLVLDNLSIDTRVKLSKWFAERNKKEKESDD